MLAYGASLRDREDPDGIHLLSKFKTNQLISKLLRGAIQLGYRREQFAPLAHMRDGQTEEMPVGHSSCAMLLSNLVSKVAGYRQYTVLSPRSDNTPNNVLCIDPFGICMLFGWDKRTIQLLAMMVDLDIPMTAKFLARLTSTRQRGGQTYQGNALRHIPEGGYLPAGRQSIIDQLVT